MRAAAQSLCQVSQDARRSVPLSRATFYDRAHEGLHGLARVTEHRDRTAAARLLEAKNAVEQDYYYQKNWPRLQGDLARLTTANRDALVAVAITPPGCVG